MPPAMWARPARLGRWGRAVPELVGARPLLGRGARMAPPARAAHAHADVVVAGAHAVAVAGAWLALWWGGRLPWQPLHPTRVHAAGRQ